MELIYQQPPAQQLQARSSSKKKLVALAVVSILLSFGLGFLSGQLSPTLWPQPVQEGKVEGEKVEKTYPLKKYSFPELMQRGGVASPITIVREISKSEKVMTYLFTFTTEGKKMSGVINIPVREQYDQPLPTLLMLRGFVSEEGYYPGAGSQHAAVLYAEQGYITVAPDFLGFGESDPQPGDSLEARFIKPANVLDLLASIEKHHLQPLIFNNKTIGRFDAHRLAMWGHSNGGQIALSILEITGRNIPTVLWAPVTKPFPYSVLFFTDESEDLGKYLRSILAEFEKDYDIDEFTVVKHADRIQSPMLLHQGTVDDAVPKGWSDDFYSLLSGKGKRELLTYHVYPGDNHGLTQNRQVIVERDLAFLAEKIQAAVLSLTPTAAPSPSASPSPAVTVLPTATVSKVATPSASPSLSPALR